MLYLDTSLVVTLLTSETKTGKAQAWLRRQSREQLAISDWVVTEFAAALAMKERLGSLTGANRLATKSWFAALAADAFEWLAVSPGHFSMANDFAERSKVGLRGGDALHLAIAAAASATLCTRDRKLAEAGAEFGVQTFLL